MSQLCHGRRTRLRLGIKLALQRTAMLTSRTGAVGTSLAFFFERLNLPVLLICLAAMPASGAIATDVVKSTDRSSSSTSITSPSFSTAASNELLLAFVATDAKSAGITVTSVSTSGLTWALVQRTNAQLGTAEIWRALAQTKLSGVTARAALSQSVAASITVVSFTGVNTSGTNGAGAI